MEERWQAMSGNAPEHFGVGGLGEDLLDGLADLADGTPAALEAVDPGLAGVEEAALNAIAEAFVLGVAAADTLLLLLERQVEELAGFVLHSLDHLRGDAVVDDLDEPPLRERLDKQFRCLFALLEVVGEQARQVHGGKLLRHFEVVVGDRRPLVFRPDELRQVGAGASQQIRFLRFRAQPTVVVALPSHEQRRPIGHLAEGMRPRLVHERLVVRRLQRLCYGHGGYNLTPSLLRNSPNSINTRCLSTPSPNHHQIVSTWQIRSNAASICNHNPPTQPDHHMISSRTHTRPPQAISLSSGKNSIVQSTSAEANS